MKPVTVSEATRFVSLLFSPNKQLFIAHLHCLNQWQKPFKQLIALFIMCTPTLFFNPVIAQFAGGSTGSTPPFIVDPLVQFLTPRSDVSSLSGSLIWGPSDNLLNDGYNVVIQAPTPPLPPAGPFFSNDFRLSVFGPRMVQKSQGNIGTATGDIWNAIGERLPFITSPGFSSNGLRSQWDGISANFGLSDDPTAGSTTRHGLIQWQDISVTSPASTTNSRLRFVFRDGNAPAAGGLATEVGTALFDGKWGFGFNNIAPLSTVDVKGGVYVGSGTATVTAGTGDGYFTNSVRIGDDAFMSGASTFSGLVIDFGRRVGIGTNNPQSFLDINASSSTTPLTLFRIPSSTNGVSMRLAAGSQFSIDNEDNGPIRFRTGGANVLNLISSGNVGVGTITPAEKLDVNGNIIVTGDVFPPGDDLYKCGKTGKRWDEVHTRLLVTTSDLRAKTNIKPISYGLSEIMKLSCISYEWKINDKGRRKIGFVAQELNLIMPEVVVVDDNPEKFLGVKYLEIIPVLVNAIKEQQGIIEKNGALVLTLESQLKDLQQKIEGKNATDNKSETILYQNEPNPFNNSTTIRYFIGNNFNTGTIEVFDDKAQLVQTFNLANTIGQGSVEFIASNLRKGVYSYSLTIDGKLIQTKKLLLGY